MGIHFKQALPDKHKHLISNLDLTDWKGMIDVVEKELANPKLVIDLVVGEIERMKITTSYKDFIDFVDSIERIERDLNTLGWLSEISNTSMLSKLEAKLPAQLNREWATQVIKEKLSEKTSQEKFNAFMDFLKQAKEITKYDINMDNGNGKKLVLCYRSGIVSKAVGSK